MNRQDWIWVTGKALGMYFLLHGVIALGVTIATMFDQNVGRFFLRLLFVSLLPAALGFYMLRDGKLVFDLVKPANGGDGADGASN